MRVAGVFLALVLCLGMGRANAQTRLDDIIARGTLRVGMTGDYRPFSQHVKDDAGEEKWSGIDVAMAGQLAEAMAVKPRIVLTTWSTLMADLTAGKFDIGMGGISINLTRQRTALFSRPLLRVGKTPIARCADKAKFATLADIDKPGIRVIVNPGGTNEKFDRANLHQAEIVLFPDNARIFDELASGRADLMITDSVETRLQQKLHKDLCAIHPEQPFDFGELGYLLPRDVIWQQYVDQFLHIAMASGAYGKLLDAELGTGDSK